MFRFIAIPESVVWRSEASERIRNIAAGIGLFVTGFGRFKLHDEKQILTLYGLGLSSALFMALPFSIDKHDVAINVARTMCFAALFLSTVEFHDRAETTAFSWIFVVVVTMWTLVVQPLLMVLIIFPILFYTYKYSKFTQLVRIVEEKEREKPVLRKKEKEKPNQHLYATKHFLSCRGYTDKQRCISHTVFFVLMLDFSIA